MPSSTIPSVQLLSILIASLLLLHSRATTCTDPTSSLRRRYLAPPTINTTVLDKTGRDITPNFTIMFLHQNITAALQQQKQQQQQQKQISNTNNSNPSPSSTPPTPSTSTVALTNLTNRSPHDLEPRTDFAENTDYGQDSLLIRAIISCKDNDEAWKTNWRLVRSECDHGTSLQSYFVWCRPYVRAPRPQPGAWGQYGPAQRLRATCTSTETCVNGPTRDRAGDVQIAYCISVDKFVELAQDLLGGGGGGGIGEKEYDQLYGSGSDEFWSGSDKSSSSRGGSSNSLASSGGSASGTDVPMDDASMNGWDFGGAAVSAVASKGDRHSPLEVGRLDVEGVGAGGGMVPGGGVCENCVDFETQQFQRGVAGLRTEARLLSTAGAGVGGVLWLAALVV